MLNGMGKIDLKIKAIAVADGNTDTPLKAAAVGLLADPRVSVVCVALKAETRPAAESDRLDGHVEIVPGSKPEMVIVVRDTDVTEELLGMLHQAGSDPALMPLKMIAQMSGAKLVLETEGIPGLPESVQLL